MESRDGSGSNGSMELEEKPDDEVELLPRPFGGYTLLAVLGHGGMGKVYLAARERIAGIARRCVVKTLRPGFGDDREYVTRFLDEARIVAQLHHRCICPVFDVGKTNGQYYIVMEYIAGRDLRSVLRRARAKGVRIDREMTLHIMGEVLEALDYAHRTTDPATGAPLALVHRDVSPQNVMIGFEGDVRLIDFGLAASTLKTERTAPNMVMGKVAYMAPEQIYGEPIDARADQFAAGVLAYELLMDERFYEKRAPREVYAAAAAGHHRPKRFDDLPGDLRVVLDRALAYSRDERYATCGALRESLVAGRPRADAPALRRLMEQVFADEILEEKRLVARLAASSSQPIAHAPDHTHIEASTAALGATAHQAAATSLLVSGAAPLAVASSPLPPSPPSAPSSPSVSVSVSASSPSSLEDEDGTVETGSAPAARAPQELTEALRPSGGAAPDTRALPRRRYVAAAVLVGAIAAIVWLATRPAGDAVTAPVIAAVVDGGAPSGSAPAVEPAPRVVEPALVVEPTAIELALEPAPVTPATPVTKKPKRVKPPKNALPGAVIRFLEQRCPSLPCARKLVAHKSDWTELPYAQLRQDLDQCVARCD